MDERGHDSGECDEQVGAVRPAEPERERDDRADRGGHRRGARREHGHGDVGAKRKRALDR
jgi:hypothetical protein